MRLKSVACSAEDDEVVNKEGDRKIAAQIKLCDLVDFSAEIAEISSAEDRKVAASAPEVIDLSGEWEKYTKVD